jgi:two-component system, OmpR family, heavy metal sensor histidine kinase CusS
MKMNLHSLHVRLAICYAALTMASMSAIGIFSYVYLSAALASSRQTTMQNRESRLLRFVEFARLRSPAVPLTTILHQYMLADPDTDVLQIETTDGKRIYPADNAPLSVSWMNGNLNTSQFAMLKMGGHRYRALQQVVQLDGEQVCLLLAGRVDSHYDILLMVRNSYLILIPLMVVASIAVGLVLSHRAMQPVDRITTSAQEISLRNLRHRLAVVESGDELQRLTEVWNDVLARLQSAIEHLTQFTSDISHDLRTTIAAMLATVQLALLRPRSCEEYRTALEAIEQECQATSTLLDDLLLAARADITERNITLAPVDLSEIVEECCDQLRVRAFMKDQKIETSTEPHAWIIGDTILLRRLVSTLLDNAVKYTPREGTIQVSISSFDETVRLDVRDTGIGIAPENMERIFDRFFRVDASRNRDEGGSGLGLAIAKWIAEAHHTSISVTSDLQSGSLFSVSFAASSYSAQSLVPLDAQLVFES